MRRWALLLTSALVLSGCRFLDRDRQPREPVKADPASRSKGTGLAKGRSWLDGPTPGLDDVGTPKADTWADPSSPNYDLARDVRGVLAGFVEDPSGRKVPDAFIEVEPANSTANRGVPVGVQTDRQGYFLIRGLEPRQTYQLTVRTTLDNREHAGRVYVQTGTAKSQQVRISLLDGLILPGGRARPTGNDRPPGGGGLPEPSLPTTPPDVGVRQPGADSGLPMPQPTDGAWSPLGPARGTPGNPPVRPEMTTEGGPGLPRPPVTSIPSGPPPTVSPPPPGQTESRSIRPGSEFLLVNTTGQTREFPSGRAGELILLDFMTTTCLPCKKAIPTLTDLQSRYGLQGLEVIGVCCDTVTLPQRRAVASRYQRDEHLNYLLYVDPTNGKLMRRFDVQGYPTLVLLDGTGEVRWQGHPADSAELERIITQVLGSNR